MELKLLIVIVMLGILPRVIIDIMNFISEIKNEENDSKQIIKGKNIENNIIQNINPNNHINISKFKNSIKGSFIGTEKNRKIFKYKNIKNIDNPNDYFERNQYISHVIKNIYENLNEKYEKDRMEFMINSDKYKISIGSSIYKCLSPISFISEYYTHHLDCHYDYYKKFRRLLNLIDNYEGFDRYPLNIVIDETDMFITYNDYIMLKINYKELNIFNYHKYCKKCLINIRTLKRYYDRYYLNENRNEKWIVIVNIF